MTQDFDFKQVPRSWDSFSTIFHSRENLVHHQITVKLTFLPRPLKILKSVDI